RSRRRGRDHVKPTRCYNNDSKGDITRVYQMNAHSNSHGPLSPRFYILRKKRGKTDSALQHAWQAILAGSIAKEAVRAFNTYMAELWSLRGISWKELARRTCR